MVVLPGRTIHVPFYDAMIDQNDGKDDFDVAHSALNLGCVALQTAHDSFYFAVVGQNDDKDEFYDAHGGAVDGKSDPNASHSLVYNCMFIL